MSSPQTEATPPPSADLIPADPRAAAFQFTVVKMFAEYAAERRKQLVADAANAFERGDRMTVTSPADRTVKLATVSTTDPKPKASVTDTAAFEAWMLEHHDDLCRDEDTLASDHAAVIDALRTYAPDAVVDQLVTTRRTVPAWATEDVLRESKQAGQPVGPGGEIDDHAPPGVTVATPPPSVTVRPAEGAVSHFAELMRGGHMAAALGITGQDAPAGQ